MNSANITGIIGIEDFLKGCENSGAAIPAVQHWNSMVSSTGVISAGTVPAHSIFPDLAACTQALVKACHHASLDSGWWHNAKTGVSIMENPMCFSNKLMLTVSELAEAMEADRKNLKDDKLPHRDGREVELADAVIRIMDLAGAYGMDLGAAIVEKMAFNAVRPDHKLANRQAEGGKAY